MVRRVRQYRQGIEMDVESADRRVRNGAAAAFAVDIERRDHLIVVSEVKRGKNDTWGVVIDKIRRDVTTKHELPPDGVILVRSCSIPKTSSGKIQRHACREAFLARELKMVAEFLLWEQSAAPSTGRSPVASEAPGAGAGPKDLASVLVAVRWHGRVVAKGGAGQCDESAAGERGGRGHLAGE